MFSVLHCVIYLDSAGVLQAWKRKGLGIETGTLPITRAGKRLPPFTDY